MTLPPPIEDEAYEARIKERQRRMREVDKAKSAEFAERMDRLRASNPQPIKSRYGARTIGDMALLEVGCQVWEHQDPTADYDRRGGMVVEITDASEINEDGEIVRRRAFKYYFWYWKPSVPSAWGILTEDQVDLDACEGPELRHIRSAYRKLCAAVGEQRGNAFAQEFEWVSVAARLAAIVGQRWS